MSRRRGRNRVNATGRNETSRFVRLDHRLLNSNPYRALSPNGRSLLVELGMLFNGENNGSLHLSIRDAAARLGVVDLQAAINAFDELEERGLIEKTRDSFFRIKAAEGSRARCWRLSWLPGPGRKVPDFSFYDHEPAPKTRARKRMERGLRALKAFRKARDTGRLPILDSDTLNVETGTLTAKPTVESRSLDWSYQGDQPFPSDRLSRAHIAITMGVAGLVGSGARPFRFDPLEPIDGPSRALPPRPSALTLPIGSNLGWRPNFGPRNEPVRWRAANDN